MSITRFKFKTDQDFKKAEGILNTAIKSIGTSHFDFGSTLADRVIRVMDNKKNADIVEGILKQNNLKFKRTEDSTSWIGPGSKLSYSSILRKLSEEISSNPVNPVITYTTKSNFGGPELVYVTSEHKEPLATLTNAKTLSDRHVKALKQLGFKLELKK